MCCGHTGHHGKGHGHHSGGHCGCGRVHLGPMFWSKKRKIKMLEEVLDGLREEVKDLEELIDELKKEK